MLSRVADSLYWMSRYLERAEHTARLLDVNLHGRLDQKPDVDGGRWERVMRSLGGGPVAGGAQEVPMRLAIDPAYSASIVSSVTAARQNAREVREQISSEMWEQVNRLYLHVLRPDARDLWDQQPHEFLRAIREGTHLFQGITESTMNREEGWFFMQFGRYLERVVAIVNLLDTYLEGRSARRASARADEYLEWVGILKSCTALEAYARMHTANIRPQRAAAFLLLNPDFPHSARFGMRRMHSALKALSERIPALKEGGTIRLVGKLSSSLGFDSIEEIMEHDIHAYLRHIRERCQLLHDQVYISCITYPVEYALTA